MIPNDTVIKYGGVSDFGRLYVPPSQPFRLGRASGRAVGELCGSDMREAEPYYVCHILPPVAWSIYGPVASERNTLFNMNYNGFSVVGHVLNFVGEN